MRKERVLEVLNWIDDDMIEAVDALRNCKKQRKTSWLRWGVLAACFCVVIAGAFLRQDLFSPGTEGGTLMDGLEAASDGTVGGDSTGEAIDGGITGEGVQADGGATSEGAEAGVTIPQMEVDLKAYSDMAMDMLAFFIYQGRSYVQYEYIYSHTDLVGEYLGTATGLIDEWTPLEGYVELAGSISGDFYAVNGFDPSFILCMKYDDDSIQTFINNNGLTLYKGVELYEDRLHLTGNYSTIDFQTHYDWNHSTDVIHTIPEKNMEVIERFIAAVNNAEFMLVDDVPLDEDESYITDREIYHLFFRMDNGMSIQMRLYEDGYVRFQGLLPVCVQVDTETFDALLGILATDQS